MKYVIIHADDHRLLIELSEPIFVNESCSFTINGIPRKLHTVWYDFDKNLVKIIVMDV